MRYFGGGIGHKTTQIQPNEEDFAMDVDGEPGDTDENQETSTGTSPQLTDHHLSELQQVVSIIEGGGLMDLDDSMSVDSDNDGKDNDENEDSDDDEDSDEDKDSDEDEDEDSNDGDGDGDNDNDNDLGPEDGEDQDYLDTGYSAL
jgi:hypothetical protein